MPTSRLYYNFKPYLPLRLRMFLRRIVARRKLRTCGGVWPINDAASRPPEGWMGWPDGKKFAFVLTHDVEGSDGLAKCRKLMRLEKKWGFRSSFNFIPEGSYSVSRELREELVQNGFELGVHDLHHDGQLYRTRSDFSKKAQRINHYLKEWGAKGFRSGFMLHELDWLHELNIQYDASTFDTNPFEPQNDGTAIIYPFWVSAAGVHSKGMPGNGQSGYVEIPYTLPQDSTLFLLFRERTPDIWLKKLDWVASRGGMAHVNVHPDYLDFEQRNCPWRHFPVSYYETLLEYVKTKYGTDCWYALPSEISDWCRKHNPAGNGKAASVSFSFDKNATWPVLKAKRAAVVLYSDFPSDPRPWRAAKALADSGMKVDVICLQEEASQAKRETVEGVNILRLPIRRKRGTN